MSTSGRRVLREQIADDLRRRIRSGKLAADEPVGSLATLQARYGAAQNTVRDALKVLADEGLVYTVPGKGSFVDGKIPAAEPSDRERLAMLEKRMGEMEAREKRIDFLETQVMDTRAAIGLEQAAPDEEAAAR